MYGLKKLGRYLRVNLLGPGHRLIEKKNLPSRGLTKIKKHCSISYVKSYSIFTFKQNKNVSRTNLCEALKSIKNSNFIGRFS